MTLHDDKMFPSYKARSKDKAHDFNIKDIQVLFEALSSSG